VTETGRLQAGKDPKELEVLLAQCYRVAVSRANAAKCLKERHRLNDEEIESMVEVNVDAKKTSKQPSK
jgi:hypothetical protein